MQIKIRLYLCLGGSCIACIFDSKIKEKGSPLSKSQCDAKLPEDPLVLNSVIPNKDFLFFFSSFPSSGWMKQKLFRDLWNWSIQARMRMWVWQDLSFVFMDSGSRKVRKNLSVFPWMVPRCLIEGDNEGWSSWMDTPSLHYRVQYWHNFFYFWSGFDFNFTTFLSSS